MALSTLKTEDLAANNVTLSDAALAGVNRRFLVAGIFNLDPRFLNRVFWFAPKHIREARQREFGGDDTIVFVDRADYEVFLDKLQPLVEESLLTTDGQPAVLVGAPNNTSRKGSTTHRINTFQLLYEGFPLDLDQKHPLNSRLGHLEQLGKQLLAQLEQDIDAYLDLVRDFDQVIQAFNRYAYDHANGLKSKRLLIHPEGESFQPNFRECLFEFLLNEDLSAPFPRGQNEDLDAKVARGILDWSDFGREWRPEDKKEFIAIGLEGFKKAILDPYSNELDQRFRNLRTTFIDQRRRFLRTAKTMSSRLMLSLLPYWVLYEMYQKAPGQVHRERDTIPLYNRIKGATSQERTLPEGHTYAGTVLDAAERTLSKAEQDRVQQAILDRVGEFVQAWGELDEGGQERQQQQERLRTSLAGQGLSADQLARIENGLKLVAELCRRSVPPGEDPKVVRARTALIVRDAWFTVHDQGYLRN